MDCFTKLYIDKGFTRHGVSLYIISDRDSQFLTRVWKTIQSALGNKINLSTVRSEGRGHVQGTTHYSTHQVTG